MSVRVSSKINNYLTHLEIFSTILSKNVLDDCNFEVLNKAIFWAKRRRAANELGFPRMRGTITTFARFSVILLHFLLVVVW